MPRPPDDRLADLVLDAIGRHLGPAKAESIQSVHLFGSGAADRLRPDRTPWC